MSNVNRNRIIVAIAAMGLLWSGPVLAERPMEEGRSGSHSAMGEGEAHPAEPAMPAQPEDAAAEREGKFQASNQGEEHVVSKGETLAEIAESKLGSSDRWKEIARANDIDDPKKLRVGQKLKIPKDSRQSS